MPAAEAVRQILRFLLMVMRHNAAGLPADNDIEYLHKLRVATRQSRVLLAQAKIVLPAAEAARFKRDLKVVGHISNKLRDLDVYLKEREGVLTAVPPLLHHLQSIRDAEWRRTVSAWESEPVGRIINEWDSFLQSGEGSDAPIRPLAQKWIQKRYEKVLKNGRKTLNTHSEAQYHALRIHCKKLRYTTEFFASLFPVAEIKPLITQVKALQTDLGVFNDVYIQRMMLMEAKEVMGVDGRLSPSLTRTLDEMIQTLKQEQQAAQTSFARKFAQFDREQNNQNSLGVFHFSRSDSHFSSTH